MKLCRGKHVYSVYFIPNIEYCKQNGYEYVCLNFLWWYIGLIR